MVNWEALRKGGGKKLGKPLHEWPGRGDCDRCKNYHMVQGADAWTWGLCACTVRYHYDQKTKAANAVMAHSQITSEEQHQRVNGLKRWGTDAQWETMQAAKAWAVQFVKALEKGTIPKWGLLIGVPGCGKTHLLNGITNVLMDMGVQVVSTYVTAMLGELKKMYNGGPNHGKTLCIYL